MGCITLYFVLRLQSQQNILNMHKRSLTEFFSSRYRIFCKISWNAYTCSNMNFIVRQKRESVHATYISVLYTLRKKGIQWFFRMVKGSTWNLLLSEPG